MDWDKHAALSETWTAQTLRYVEEVNAFVAKGLQDGWDAAGPEPDDVRTEALAAQVVDVVREANAAGQWQQLRHRFPVAHRPFISFLEAQARGVNSVVWIAEDRVVARLGSGWDPDATMQFTTDGDAAIVAGIDAVGRCGNWFALTRGGQIELVEEWGSPPALRLPMPSGIEGVPETAGVAVEPPERPWLEAITPLPDGSGALVVLHEGVFLSTSDGIRRVFPEPLSIGAELEQVAEEGDGTFTPYYDMIHAALSPDGSMVACGGQDSQHLLLSREGVCLARFGPVHSSYPHHACFSPNGALACFNSCHFYGGVTVGATVETLRGMALAEYDDDPRLRILDEGMRVYASTWFDDAFVFGDAYGHIRAIRPDGTEKWHHFVGSTVEAISPSPDGKLLAVGTAAGFLVFLEVEPEAPDRAMIGNAGFAERLRYITWRGEPIWRW